MNLNPVAALDINDQELTKFVAKDFAEDIATTSDSGTSFTSNTLTADVQDVIYSQLPQMQTLPHGQ